MITIVSPTRIEVDGKDAGLPLDYFLANPLKRDEVKAAFVAWHASHVRADQERNALVDAAIALAQSEKDAAIAVLKADLDALGTKEEAQAIRKAKELEALRKQAADTAAKIAALSGEPLPTDEAKP